MISNGSLWRPSPRRNSVMRPCGVIRPIAGRAPSSVNHRFPSAPAAIVKGTLPRASPRRYSVILPWRPTRPIAQWPSTMQLTSSNHTAPSGPVVSPNRETCDRGPSTPR